MSQNNYFISTLYTCKYIHNCIQSITNYYTDAKAAVDNQANAIYFTDSEKEPQNVCLTGGIYKQYVQLVFYEANDVDDDGFVFKVFEGEVFIELDVPYNKNEIDDFEEKALELLDIDEDLIISIN